MPLSQRIITSGVYSNVNLTTYFLIFDTKNKPACDDKLEMEKEVLGIKEGHHAARKIERLFYANDIH